MSRVPAQRHLRLLVEQGREFERICGADAVIVHDAQRIVGLRHVQARERRQDPPMA